MVPAGQCSLLWSRLIGYQRLDRCPQGCPNRTYEYLLPHQLLTVMVIAVLVPLTPPA